jgi:hypothetical protein
MFALVVWKSEEWRWTTQEMAAESRCKMSQLFRGRSVGSHPRSGGGYVVCFVFARISVPGRTPQSPE